MVSNSKIRQAGFTLMEVLVSLSILGSIALSVVYMNISNINEVLRHNAENYANSIAEEQFSALMAYRNQIAFDRDANSNWRQNLIALRDSSSYFYLRLRGNKWEVETLGTSDDAWREENRVVSSAGSLPLAYRLRLEPVYKETDSSKKEDGMVKVHLQVKWQDRFGRIRIKDFYTLLANYL